MWYVYVWSSILSLTVCDVEPSWQYILERRYDLMGAGIFLRLIWNIGFAFFPLIYAICMISLYSFHSVSVFLRTLQFQQLYTFTNSSIKELLFIKVIQIKAMVFYLWLINTILNYWFSSFSVFCINKCIQLIIKWMFD
jgi:hypothetical protein